MAQINVRDHELINDQVTLRDNGKNRLPVSNSAIFKKGTLVCIRNERTKHQMRPRYIVDRVDGSWLFLHKLTDTQLRAKLYKVHQNACIPLSNLSPSTSSARKNVQPPESSSDSESDSDSNSEHSTSEGQTTSPNSSVAGQYLQSNSST